MKSPTNSLRYLAHQNHYAARQLQRVFRGFSTRRKLRSYGGIFYAHSALKVQRCWRGYRGRQVAAQRYIYFLTEKAEIIRGLCRCWKARRVLRMKRAAHLDSCATMLQCLYRTRTSRKYFAELKKQALKRKATLLQKIVRGFVARQWVGRLRKRVSSVRGEMITAIKDDIKTANTAKAKMTLELLSAVDVTRASGAYLPSRLRRASGACSNFSDSDLAALEQWNLLHTALCSLVGTGRPDFASDQIALLLSKHPTFLPGYFVHACCILSSWCTPSTRSAMLIREYDMEEAVAIVLRLQQIQLAALKRYNEAHGLPKPDKSDPYCTQIVDEFVAPYEKSKSREMNYLFHLEKLYFANGFATGGVGARTLTLMATFVMVRSFSAFGSGMQRLGPRQGDAIGRARRLFDKAKEKVSVRETEGINLQLQVFHNLFESTHESIIRHRKVFHDLSEELDAHISRKPVQTDLEIFRCGEVLLVVGFIVPQKDRDKSGKANPPSDDDPDEAKWTPSKCDVTLRPLVLLPQEVLKVYQQAVVFFMHSLGKTEIEVRQKSKWKVLAEYVMQGVRIHSCGRGRERARERGTRSIDHGHPALQSVARLSLPCIEYVRQERNDIRVENHCAKLLQRAYRGFQGRAHWKRLHLRVLEQKRQKEAFKQNYERMKKLRDWRYERLAYIQSRVKGWYLRRKMARHQRASVVIQCMARRHQARQRVIQERIRRDGGPEVVEMIRRGADVSGVKMTVVVYRCGMNYKIIGHDIMGGSQYQGFIYQPEVLEKIEEYNKQFSGSSWAMQQAQIKPWQHMRVAEMLLKNTSLTSSVAAVTKDLGKGYGGREADMVFVQKSDVHGPRIGSKPRKRVLGDQKEVYEQYERLQTFAALRKERAEKKRFRQIMNKAY